MAYTSEQYKYLLFRRLQRHFSMSNPAERYYTQSFFGKLFDESIVVTEEAYNKFVDAMDYEIQYCFDNDIYECSDITTAMIETHQHLLIEAFAAIDIDLVIEVIRSSDGFATGGNATFTKPNGEVMVYEVRGGLGTTKNNFTINTAARTEYNYAKLSAPYYNFEIGDVFELDEYNPMAAGINTYWSYDLDTKTMTITGDGAYVSCPTETQVGGGDYSVIILGANVSKISSGAFDHKLRAIVLWHSSDVELLLDSGIISDRNNVYSLEVYCDNEDFRNYANFPAGIKINWHTLDEWSGADNVPDRDCLYYNGVLLPEFRSTDPENNTCLVIGTYSDGSYYATVSAEPLTLSEGATTLNTNSIVGWSYDADNCVWIRCGLYNKPITPIWANYDVLDSNGNVYLAASEPSIDQ